MKNGALQVARCGLMLVTVVFATAASAQYFLSFNGTPSSIACSNTDFNVGPGLSYSWNFPSASTLVEVNGTAGAAIVTSGPQSFGQSGTQTLTGGPSSYASQAFPYTVKYVLTPLADGAPTSSFSFMCASAVGTNFTISNGGLFSNVIPTLDWWGLALLAALLGVATIFLLRGRPGAG